MYLKKSDPLVNQIISQLKDWPGERLKRHNDANHLLHKLVFIADLGFTNSDGNIREISEKILSLQSKEGPFHLIINIPTVFGGSGTDEYSWMLCDAPLPVYALAEFGYHNNDQVIRARDYILGLSRDNGWPCAASQIYSKKFKGPGRREDPCPYANLVVLRMISAFPELIESEYAITAIDTLEYLWSVRKEKKPFLFGMGTDFKKLKAPFIWYDILHVLEVLSKFPQARNTRVYSDLIGILKERKNDDGQYYAKSVYRAWKDFDFGQKKVPSEFITQKVRSFLQ